MFVKARPNDYKLIKKTIICFLVILLSYHYIHNFHLLLSPSTATKPTSEDNNYLSPKGFNFNFAPKPHRYYSKAFHQSFGFFTDISNHDWEIYRQRYQNHDRHIEGDVRNNRIHLDNSHIDDEGNQTSKNDSSSNAHLFYQNNYDPEFTCPHEIQLGAHTDGRVGETPKWVCDPHRIIPMSRQRQERNNQNGCLAYIFTEEDSRKFIKDLNSVLEKECDIHVFSKQIYNLIYMSKVSLGDNIHVHPWGIEGECDVQKGRTDYLTFQETLNELNHDGKNIDLISIDCEGCEWEIYLDIVNADVSITQIMVELHSAPYLVNDFFLEMKRHGYVIFHKEANIVHHDGQGGKNQEYSFLHLAPEFFSSNYL